MRLHYLISIAAVVLIGFGMKVFFFPIPAEAEINELKNSLNVLQMHRPGLPVQKMDDMTFVFSNDWSVRLIPKQWERDVANQTSHHRMTPRELREFNKWLQANTILGSILAIGMLAMAYAGSNSLAPSDVAMADSPVSVIQTIRPIEKHGARE
jgi:hypothetical protein